MVAKPLRIRCNNIDGFIQVYGEIAAIKFVIGLNTL